MSASVEKPVVITRYMPLFKLSGGSQPMLAAASDDHLYVVKFRNNPQGKQILFNEAMGTELYKALGLAVPEWKPLMLTDSFVDQNPSCWMKTSNGLLRPESGLCFGSRFLGEGLPRLYDFLPGALFPKLSNAHQFWLAWLADACAWNKDGRQVVFRHPHGRRVTAYFVDHGHLFGGPPTAEKRPMIAPNYWDKRIYPSVSDRVLEQFRLKISRVDADKLYNHAKLLPEDWRTPSGLQSFERGLRMISTPAVAERVLDGILRYQRSKYGSERNLPQLDFRKQTRLLRAEVSAA